MHKQTEIYEKKEENESQDKMKMSSHSYHIFITLIDDGPNLTSDVHLALVLILCVITDGPALRTS